MICCYSVGVEVDEHEGSSTETSLSGPNIRALGYEYLKCFEHGGYSLYISDRYSRVLRRAQWFGDQITAISG